MIVTSYRAGCFSTSLAKTLGLLQIHAKV